MQKQPVHWKTIKVRLGDLKPWEKNPRKISESAKRRLLESWEEFGEVDTIAVDPEMTVINGHQRLNAFC